MTTETATATKKPATRRRPKFGRWPFDGALRRPPAPPPAPPALPDAPELDADEAAAALESLGTLPDDPGSRWMMPLLYAPPRSDWDIPRVAAPRQLTIDGELFDGSDEDLESTIPVFEGETFEFSEEVVVRLHWRLLEDVKGLRDPSVSLLQKLDVLGWVFTDPELDGTPFSFTSCVEVVSCSPLAAFAKLPAYMGKVDIWELRDMLRNSIRKSMANAFGGYPPEVRRFMLENPKFVMEMLGRDPQWLNKLSVLPPEIRALLLVNTDCLTRMLAKDPQWLSKQVGKQKQTAQGDLLG